MTTLTIISKEELKEKIERGDDFQLVNVLTPDYYHLGSIKGSLKIPCDELEKRLSELDRAKETVVYCASYACQASKKAAEFLAKRGFRVEAYEGGIKEWSEAGFPMETGTAPRAEAKKKGSCSCD